MSGWVSILICLAGVTAAGLFGHLMAKRDARLGRAPEQRQDPWKW